MKHRILQSGEIMTLLEFKKKLDSFRKPIMYNPYEGSDRTTHCYITITKDNVEHKFEVRYWKLKNKPRRLCIQAVNWTITAGPCTITIDKTNINDWKIEDI